MARLNLTLDEETLRRLSRRARGRRTATMARELINEALDARNQLERRRKLAKDYAAGREDALELLRDLEGPQFETLDAAGE